MDLSKSTIVASRKSQTDPVRVGGSKKKNMLSVRMSNGKIFRIFFFFFFQMQWQARLVVIPVLNQAVRAGSTLYFITWLHWYSKGGRSLPCSSSLLHPSCSLSPFLSSSIIFLSSLSLLCSYLPHPTFLNTSLPLPRLFQYGVAVAPGSLHYFFTVQWPLLSTWCPSGISVISICVTCLSLF